MSNVLEAASGLSLVRRVKLYVSYLTYLILKVYLPIILPAEEQLCLRYGLEKYLQRL